MHITKAIQYRSVDRERAFGGNGYLKRLHQFFSLKPEYVGLVNRIIHKSL